MWLRVVAPPHPFSPGTWSLSGLVGGGTGLCECVCVCVTAVYSANSKACRAQRPARRCTLMSRGHGRSLLRSRAIIKHDGTRREANIWHCQNGKGWWWRGRDAPPSLLLPSLPPSLRLHRRGSALISSWICLPCLSRSITPARD